MNPIIRLLLLTMLICALSTANRELVYGQDDYLDVKENIKAKTFTFRPFTGDTGGLPSIPVEGEFYYDHSDTTNAPVYYDGSQWNSFSSLNQTGKFVATHIVAPFGYPYPNKATIVCDREKPDNEYIQDAINALPAGVGGSVYLLEGAYTIKAPININKSDVTLFGSGNATVLQADPSLSAEIIKVSSPASRVLISLLEIDGNNNTAQEGIKLDSVSHSKIDSVLVRNVASYGIHLNASVNNTITNCGLQSMPASLTEGVRLEASSSYNIISRNMFAGNRKAIYINSSHNNTIIYNLIPSVGFAGVHLENSSAGNIISANIIHGTSAGGIGLSNSHRNTVSDNTISDVGLNGIALVSGSANNLISGNNIKNSVGAGILISGSSKNSIIKNAVSLTPNDGIKITGTSQYNLIASNWVEYNSSAYGYPYLEPVYCENYCYITLTDANCTDNYIVSNNLGSMGNGIYAGRVKDLGIRNSYTDTHKISIKRMFDYPSALEISASNYTLSPNQIEGKGGYSYIPLRAVGDHKVVNLSAGGAKGDILMLEGTNTDSKRIGIPCDSTTTKLSQNDCTPSGGSWYRVLANSDYLELIWNGEKWLEVSYCRNSQ